MTGEVDRAELQREEIARFFYQPPAIPDPNVGNTVAQRWDEARLAQLALAGGAMQRAGWKPLGGGLFQGDLDTAWLAANAQTTTETFTMVDPPQLVLATNTTQEVSEEVLSFGPLEGGFTWKLHRLEANRIESDGATIVGGGYVLPQIVSTGDALLTLRRTPQLLNYVHTAYSNAGGVVSYDTGSGVILANVRYDYEIEAYNRIATVRNVIADPVSALPLNQMTGAQVRVDMTRVETRYLNVNEIVGGASANTISAVSGGAGFFGLLTLVDGGAGDDTITGSGFLYGNTGDDTISAVRSTLIGGDGNDTLTGTGASRFVFTAGESGIDSVAESGAYATAYLDWYYGDLGVSDLRERAEHGGKYRLDLEGLGGYYDTFEEAEAARQSAGYGELVYVEPLSSVAPLVQRGDTATLESLIAAGVMSRDVVEFGPGLTLSDLTLTLTVSAAEAAGYPGEPALAGGTLSVRWGNAGFDIEVPDTNYGMAGSDLIADQVGAGDSYPRRTYRLGEGVETFLFADGTSYSLEQVLAQAVVIELLGPFHFFRDTGAQAIGRDHEAIVFEDGIRSYEVSVSRDGVALQRWSQEIGQGVK